MVDLCLDENCTNNELLEFNYEEKGKSYMVIYDYNLKSESWSVAGLYM